MPSKVKTRKNHVHYISLPKTRPSKHLFASCQSHDPPNLHHNHDKSGRAQLSLPSQILQLWASLLLHLHFSIIQRHERPYYHAPAGLALCLFPLSSPSSSLTCNIGVIRGFSGIKSGMQCLLGWCSFFFLLSPVINLAWIVSNSTSSSMLVWVINCCAASIVVGRD